MKLIIHYLHQCLSFLGDPALIPHCLRHSYDAVPALVALLFTPGAIKMNTDLQAPQHLLIHSFLVEFLFCCQPSLFAGAQHTHQRGLFLNT
jgi:hypothetical protein